ncbi:MAG: hypothetical protein AABZ32_01360 [Bacteroidota bacterium]
MKNIDKEKLATRFKEMLEQWENNPERMKSGLQYEETFVKMMREFGKEVFQESMGKISHDKNSKKK